LQEQPAERAGEISQRLVMAQSRPGPAAAILLHDMIGAKPGDASRDDRASSI
jgi:hypothetical protein